MSILDMATQFLLTFAIIVLAIAVCFCLLRGLLGPRFTDRIISVNLIGTNTIMLICILALLIGEDYLVDVALVYSLISFLAVVVLVNLYIEAHHRKKNRETTCAEEKTEWEEEE